MATRKAVSYTHLDVYKRQPADLARVPVTLDKDPDLHTLVTD